MVNLINDGYFDTKTNDKILAKCKKCGNRSPAKDFRFDDEANSMICPECFRRPSLKKIIGKKNEIAEEKPKSIIIHNEKDVFRKVFEQRKTKKEIKSVIDKKVRYTCDKCGFIFKYSPAKDWPKVCPGCRRSVKNIRKGMGLIY